MTNELEMRLENHVEVILDALENADEDGNVITPLTNEQRKQLSDELRVTLQGLTENDKTMYNGVVEVHKSRLTPGRAILELSKAVLPVAISGGIILTCHRWGYVFEESGMRRLSDVWRRMPNMKI